MQENPTADYTLNEVEEILVEEFDENFDRCLYEFFRARNQHCKPECYNQELLQLQLSKKQLRVVALEASYRCLEPWLVKTFDRALAYSGYWNSTKPSALSIKKAKKLKIELLSRILTVNGGEVRVNLGSSVQDVALEVYERVIEKKPPPISLPTI